MSGSGPLLIKAATWLSHLEYDWESPVWRHLLHELSRQRTFVRYDERGCGLSDWDGRRPGFDSWVRDLETVADALGRRALRAARHLAGRVDRDRLRGAPSGARHAPGAARRLRARPAGAQQHARAARRGRDDVQAGRARLGQGRPVVPPVLHQPVHPRRHARAAPWFNELERISTSPANAARFMREFDRIDVTALLPQVRCPTLVLHSRHDVRVPFDEGPADRQRDPRCALRADRQRQPPAARKRARLAALDRRGARVPAARRRRARRPHVRRADRRASASCSS